jgi:hypothetical protein
VLIIAYINQSSKTLIISVCLYQGTKLNGKNGKFPETKRNGKEKNYRIKKRNETKRKATGNETKPNDIIQKRKKRYGKKKN